MDNDEIGVYFISELHNIRDAESGCDNGDIQKQHLVLNILHPDERDEHERVFFVQRHKRGPNVREV